MRREQGPPRLAALALVLLMAFPASALANEQVPSSFSTPSPSFLPLTPFAPGLGLPMRTPDASALGEAPDLPAQAPAPGRTLLATPGSWTVLVYMVADNDLEPFAIQDLNEMEALQLPAGVSVVVQIDRSSRYDTSNGDWTNARRYQILRDSNASAVGSLLLDDLGEVNMGDPQTLVEFLAWGVDTFPADRYLVVLWDHGYGWSGGLGNDLGNGDHLSLPEIGSAMRRSAVHLGRPFDVLAFDACLMQQVEVLFELSETADFFVGAEDLEPAAGWPYDEMLAPLQRTSSPAAEELARALVEAYMDHYGTQSDTMMSAVRARTLRTGLGNALNSLAAKLAGAVSDPQTMTDDSAEAAIWQARNLSPTTFNADYIDLGDFARRLEQDARIPPSARAVAADLRAALNASVFAERHSVFKEGLTGLTIYLPAFSVPTRYLGTRWANESFWDEFLVAFLSGVPLAGSAPGLTLTSPSSGERVARRFHASADAFAAAGQPLRLQYRPLWGNWTDFGIGLSPLSVVATLDAGASSGAARVTLRALDSAGRPSDAVELALQVEGMPVELAPPASDLAVAINRSRTFSFNATPSASFSSFDVVLAGLPSGVSSAGSTTFVAAGGSLAPFPLDLALAAGPTAQPGSYPLQLSVRPSSVPTLEAIYDFALELSQPFADLALAPLVFSNDLPLPNETVQVWSNLSNRGFDDAPGARLTAAFTDGSGATTQIANFTLGPLAAGAQKPLEFNFTAALGTQRFVVAAALEPAAPELNASNNMGERTIIIARHAVELSSPPQPVRGGAGGSPTPVAVRLLNNGTDADSYALFATDFDPPTWTVALPGSTVSLAGRTALTFAVEVTPPVSAVGGDAFRFNLTAASANDSSVRTTVALVVTIEEIFDAEVNATPNDVLLPFGGASAVKVTLANRGNGPELFALFLQNGDAKLEASLDNTTFALPPGAVGTTGLRLGDKGLLATDRPYTVELVAVSEGSGQRFSTILSVRPEPETSLRIEPLEPSVDVSEDGRAPLRFVIRNTGNTQALAALSANASDPNLTVDLPAAGALLLPGSFLLINASANFSAPPLAGIYTVVVRAVDTRTGAAAEENLSFVVPVRPGFTASVSGTTPPGGDRVLRRTLLIRNTGNAAETFTLTYGFLPPGVHVELVPALNTFTVPARGERSFELLIQGPAASSASAELQIFIEGASGGSSRVVVPYAFAAPLQDPVLVYSFVGALAAATAVMIAFAYRQTGRKRPPEEGEETG